LNEDEVQEVLLAEHAALTQQVDEVHRSQFQITTAVNLASLGGIAVFFEQLQRTPLFLLPIAGLALAHILYVLEMELRIRGLSRRLKDVEKQLRVTAGSEHIARWESEYVPVLFDYGGQSHDYGRGLTSRLKRLALVLSMRVLRIAYMLPLLFVYFLCPGLGCHWEVKGCWLWTALALVILVASAKAFTSIRGVVMERLEANEAGLPGDFKRRLEQSRAKDRKQSESS